MTDVLMIGEGPPPAPARAAVGYDNCTVCTGAAGADSTTSSGQGCKIHLGVYPLTPGIRYPIELFKRKLKTFRIEHTRNLTRD